MKTITNMTYLTFALFACACFALLPAPNAFGVVPAPDGGYPNFTTAEGQNALFSLTTGAANTGVGWFSLFSNSDGSFNTGVGAGTLLFNIGDQATFDGVENTAIGAAALLFNTTGSANTAVGTTALLNNTTGNINTACGAGTLQNNTTGTSNIAVGHNAGFNLTTGNGNIDIANFGFAGESNTIRIGTGGNQTATYVAGIFGATATDGAAVFVDNIGKLGTVTSSARFKDDIKPMDKASEALFSLKPVTFRYKKEIDPAGTAQLGLVAEEVEKVNPDLVVRDKEGKPYSVRYEQVNAMLLNEFLKAHRRIEEQDKRIDQLTTQLKEQALLIQKVNDKVELNRPAPQTVANDR